MFALVILLDLLQVQAFEADSVNMGPVFRIPITVIIPEKYEIETHYCNNLSCLVLWQTKAKRGSKAFSCACTRNATFFHLRDKNCINTILLTLQCQPTS